MSESLIENSYIWISGQNHPDDGLFSPVAYFTNYDKAVAHCNKHKLSRVVQTTLWKSNLGPYYQINYRNAVLVDAPEKDEILAKLTDIEKKVLGLK